MIDLRFLSRTVSSLAVCCLALGLSAPVASPAATAQRKTASGSTLRKRPRLGARTRTALNTSRTNAALIHAGGVRPNAVVHANIGRSGLIRGRALRPGLAATRRARRALWSPWTEPTYADSFVGDNIDGDDLLVRQAAAEALGPYNGTIVVSDPSTGRVLSVVNQKLGLKGAFQPCSTVKVVVSFASLNEGLVEPDTKVKLSRRTSLDLTGALAHSNNLYFAKMGESLGFERFQKYAKLFGLGEKAGLDIAGEEPGTLANETPRSGMGMMTSFGDGIRLTPLELASIVGTVANGGTMYYLQYPKSQEEVVKFTPRIKRELDIARFIPQIRPGMMGAVEYGTARRAVYDETDPVFGKTGTCTDTANPGVHLGWFGSFNDIGKNKVSVVVLLTGGRGVGGGVAAGIAGNVYRNLTKLHYFGDNHVAAIVPADPGTTPTKLVSMENPVRQ